MIDNNFTIDDLIHELEYKRESALNNPEDYFATSDLDVWKKGIKDLDDKIFELRIKSIAYKNIPHEQDKGTIVAGEGMSSMVLGDITITPGKCITIGNTAMIDKATFNDAKDIFEKGRATIPTIHSKHILPNKLLGKGQFGGGLKFVYAIVKYVFMKKINKVHNSYKIDIDSDFLKYFKEAEQFDFLSKSTKKLSFDDSTYWNSNRSYAKKIMTLSSIVSMLDKTEHGYSFEVIENK